MAVLLPIGEFSKMTHLSVKALRHYHDVGLLEPAAVDDGNGYRLYAPDQVPVAQAIRRFRELEMPLDRIREVLAAPDLATRNKVIETHLDELHAQLARTQQAVASLQALLGAPPVAATIEVRALPAARVLAVADTITPDDCEAWLEEAFAELHPALLASGLQPGGPDGALYDEPFFHDDEGRVTAFVPIEEGDLRAQTAGTGRTQLLDLPAASFAVLVHDGPFAELDRAYGALGTAVAARGVGLPGAIREHYLDDVRTEVCWPVRS